ncbi:hypothetical protein HFO89_33755 [Rhizobium leguminosarum]|uniref:hypothetical protein n=1 Tax=Rhizobium leguminosarum TaxID=384 RepID=UPI001C967F87|nr:hypothetical protein [Rhizobium leguminosarum]MBY5461230.1 hypothetical protein [Rhizobium leguminosarum]
MSDNVKLTCNLGRRFKRAGAPARIIALSLCASQLTACIAAFPRDSVPQQFASAAEPPGYQHDIRVWGDSYASYPAGRLVRLRDERLKASKADPSINTGELNALTLSGGGSSGAFGAGILAS